MQWCKSVNNNAIQRNSTQFNAIVIDRKRISRQQGANWPKPMPEWPKLTAPMSVFEFANIHLQRHGQAIGYDVRVAPVA
jgi:hypothetical protein